MRMKNNKLYQKFMADDAGGQFLRYAFVGVLNTIVGYGTYWLCLRFGLHYAIASLAGQILGTANSYVWNKFFTFRSKTATAKKSLAEMVRFCSVYAAQYGANVGLIALFVHGIGLSEEWAGLIAMVLCTVISYVGHKFWSFKK
ncbi:MAG TPA: GtrA family protein [Clostridiales bacterium]|nr:GtrA family protein [Clostridiales bacterium]